MKRAQRTSLLLCGWLLLIGGCGADTKSSGGGNSGQDTAVADAGAPDTATSDSGTSDTGTSDAGTSDVGTSDAGTSDAGTSDAGTSDAGTSDGGADGSSVADAGPSDAAVADSAGEDSGGSDAASDSGSSSVSDATSDAGDATASDATATDGGGKDAGGWVPPPPGPADLVYDIKNITLQPGQEEIMCFYFPPDGKERWMHAVTSEFKYGLHHLRVDRMYDAKTKKAFGPVDCLNGTNHAPGDGKNWYTTGELPGAQDNHMQMQFPAGTGFRIGPKHGLYIEAHVLNTTLKPVKIEGKYHIYTVDKSKVNASVGLVLAFNNKLSYPPKQISTQTSSCTFTKPYTLIFGTGHMHAYGTLLEAWVNNDKIYSTTDVEDVEITPYTPPILIKPGDKLTWSCTYNNTTSKPLNLGFSDIYAAMCGFVGFIYPTKDSEAIFCE